MPTDLEISTLIPTGLTVEHIARTDEAITVAASSAHAEGRCPRCRAVSRRVHSRYVRQVSDLPCSGRRLCLRLLARRFFCDAPHCERRIFVERFDAAIVAERSRRTARLEGLVHHLGLALGGRPAAGLAKRLMVPVSNDTLLRVVRRRAGVRTEALTIVGIDDWAFRRNHRYGTVVCDLERRRIVALLPNRETATVSAWLAEHPEIQILSRDRGGGYGEAAARALPNAVQVADRWHLMENASAAFLDAVRKSMHVVRRAIGATTIDQTLLTSAEKLQYEGYLRRKQANSAIVALADQGISIKEIMRRTGHSRKLVRHVVRGQRTDIFRTRQSTLDAHLPFLDAHWEAGCRNGAELWRRLKDQGFYGSLRVVGEWSTRRRRAEQASEKQLHKVPSARTIARMMTMARDHLSKADTVTVAAIEAGVPALAEARALTDRFHTIIRKGVVAEFDAWIAAAGRSLIASFVTGIEKDKAAVRAAITEPWSNGQTEGQITKLKMVKRQMYGRAKIDLLEARLLGA